MTLRYLLLAGVTIVSAVLGPARPAAADLAVLLKSGDIAPDGRSLSGFSSPIAASKTKAAFLGTTSAVITKDGSTFATVVKTGDPLPAPLVGTFNSFFDPVINDAGNVAFRANLNSTGADSGLFYCCDAGAIVPIVLTGGTLGGPLRVRNPPDMNNNGDVVYELDDTEIHLWSLTTLTDATLVVSGQPAPGGGTFDDFSDRPVVNDAKKVAFQSDVSGGPEGIFVTAPSSSVTACALEGAACPIAGGTYRPFASTAEVSINAGGKVAFTSDIALTGPDTSGVFRCDPSGPSVVTIAKEGDSVGGTPLTGFDDEYVGIDTADDVVFEGRFGITRKLVVGAGGPLSALTTFTGNPSEFAPRATDIGQVIWRQTPQILRYDGGVTPIVGPSDATPIGLRVTPREPSINNLGVAVFRATQSVLYFLDHGALQAIAAPGGPSPGIGTYSFIGAPVLRGSTLAFAANDDGGIGTVIAMKRGGGPLTHALHSGDPAPGGGTLDLDSFILDVKGSKVLFESTISGGAVSGGLFRKNTSSGVIDTLVLQGDPAPSTDTFDSFIAVHPAGNEAAFVAVLDTAATGVFITDPLGPVQIALEGDPLPDTGGGTLSQLGPVAVSGKRVAFTGLVSGGTVADGIFLWDHGTLVRLVSQGDPAVGGATFGPLPTDAVSSGTFSPFALARSPAFVAPLVGGSAFEGLFFARADGSIVSVALVGDPSPLGGGVSALNLGEPISRIGNNVVLEVDLSGASSAVALMRAKP